ncbi:MAG: sugar phosphate isomerase/epimerase [Clostridia bacterium]|nr:sugar phosphate isomerase/epimerase [Clostridia bacterium]
MSDFRFGFTRDFGDANIIHNGGADYQELNLGNIAKMSVGELDTYIAGAQANGYSFEAANCMIPGEYKITVKNPDYAAIDEYLERAYSKAARIGLKIVVMGSSGARNFPDDVTYDEAFDKLVIFLKDHVVPVCEKYGIVCALENLSYGESNILNTIDESLRVVEAVGSEWVKILVDFYHFGNNKDSLDSIRRAGSHIVHIHVASVLNGRIYPAHEDSEDYSVITDILREIGYDKREGRISFEARVPDGKDFAQCVNESLAVFENL